MIHWHRVPLWLLRAWPVLALIPAVIVHWAALRHFADAPALVNKIAGMVLQAAGGLLILYSINDNLGLFRRQSLFAAAVTWFKSFPVARQPVTIQLSGADCLSMAGSMSASVSTPAKTIEEWVSRLEEGLQSLQKDVVANAIAAQEQLQAAKLEFGRRIDETASRVTDLTNKVEHAAVGGFKLQAFGVLLAIYGAVTSVFA